MNKQQLTLTEALSKMGISHKPSKIQYKNMLVAGNGRELYPVDASEGWKLVNMIERGKPS